MRKTFMTMSMIAASVFMGVGTFAQGKPYDQAAIEKQARIGEDSAKLARLMAMVPQYEKDKQNAADQAQQSADANKSAADKLSNDPQDKKLAKKADKAASLARSDARKAREASDKLDDLNKEIKKLTRELEKEQAKLQKYEAGLKPGTMDAKDSVAN
ncbi:MAG TPA: hypothetical protein VGR89_05055 [Puia sp.]|nr:hypothetical protein [Puia sp.]